MTIPFQPGYTGTFVTAPGYQEPHGFPSPAGFELQAATGINGFTLINGTPVILTWNVPNDGQKHRWICFCTINVTSLETGGAVNANWTIAGVAQSNALSAGGSAAGIVNGNYRAALCDPGTQVTVTQTALTAGAAVLFAEIWGA